MAKKRNPMMHVDYAPPLPNFTKAELDGYMSDSFEKGDKVIISDSTHDHYGEQFVVEKSNLAKNNRDGNIFIVKEGSTLGFSVLPAEIKHWRPYVQTSMDYEDGDWGNEPIVDYAAYSEMDDLEIDGESAFVISNDPANKKIIIEFVDSGEMKTIDYSKPISTPKVSSTKYLTVQEALDTKIKRGTIISGGGGSKQATDKQMNEVSLEKYWDYSAVKFNGWMVFFVSSGQQLFFETMGEAIEYIDRKGLDDVSDQRLSRGGSIKSNWFSGELSFLNW